MLRPRTDHIRSGALTLLVGFLLLGVVIAGTSWFVSAEQQSGAAVRTSLDVETRLYRLLSLLQDAETGQRGFLLTGDAAYLAPYQRAIATLDPAFAGLADALRDRPGAIEQLARLHTLADNKLTELTTTIELRRGGRTEEALATVRSGTGKSFMDQARDVIATLLSREQAALGVDEASAARAAWWLQVCVVAAVFLLVLCAGFALAMSAQQLRRAVESRDALRSAHDQLVQEVMQREQVEGQLRQAQKMEAIGQLTGGIAHDFNNMLGVIIGSLSLLERRRARGQTDLKRFVDAAMDGANRAAALTQRLLAFSRQQPLRPVAVDINRFVAGIEDLLRRAVGEAIRLETVLAGGIWKTHTDVSQLESAILNLAVNARDAMPEGGRLTIETANSHLDEGYAARHVEVPAGQYVLLAVTDTGAGMAPEVIAKAFDPFFTTKDAGAGTGLGLSQVYGFVKQSNGHVKIYSEIGVGTTVKIYLPRFIGDAALEAAEQSPPRLATGDAREVVLVVEDEERVRQLSVESLRELGYTVLQADGATTALRILDSHPEISVLFTDIIMPEVNGRKLAEEALRRRPELKVLYTTGYTRNAIVHNNVLDPGVQLITKPFSLDLLATKMREVLG